MLHSIKSALIIHCHRMEISHPNLLHPLGLNLLACASVLLVFFRETYLIFSG